jgi:hypothetical protein
MRARPYEFDTQMINKFSSCMYPNVHCRVHRISPLNSTTCRWTTPHPDAQLLWNQFQYLPIFTRRRGSEVCIVTGHGLNCRVVGIRVSVGARFFFFPRLPHRFLGTPYLTSNGYWGLHAGWSWPLTSKQCWGQEHLDLCNPSPHTSLWRCP